MLTGYEARVEMLLSVQWMDNLPSVYDGCCRCPAADTGQRWVTKIVTTAFVNLLFGGGNNGTVEKLFTAFVPINLLFLIFSKV